MYAGVLFYNLKHLRKAIEDDLPAALNGLVPTRKEILPILRRQKKEPDYFHYPAIPDPKVTA